MSASPLRLMEDGDEEEDMRDPSVNDVDGIIEDASQGCGEEVGGIAADGDEDDTGEESIDRATSAARIPPNDSPARYTGRGSVGFGRLFFCFDFFCLDECSGPALE